MAHDSLLAADKITHRPFMRETSKTSAVNKTDVQQGFNYIFHEDRVYIYKYHKEIYNYSNAILV